MRPQKGCLYVVAVGAAAVANSVAEEVVVVEAVGRSAVAADNLAAAAQRTSPIAVLLAAKQGCRSSAESAPGSWSVWATGSGRVIEQRGCLHSLRVGLTCLRSSSAVVAVVAVAVGSRRRDCSPSAEPAGGSPD